MAMVDVGEFQEWIRAYDNWERAQRRYDALSAFDNGPFTEFLRESLETARKNYNAAIKDMKQQ
jgi:hypothetical protein